MENTDKENESPYRALPVVLRKKWKAKKAKSTKPLKLPIKHVVYTQTETVSCNTSDECKKIVRALQRYHMDLQGLTDIKYHFLIGGDGQVYEGRGWFVAGATCTKDEKPDETTKETAEGTTQETAEETTQETAQGTAQEIGPETESAIEVAFIGSFYNKQPTEEMALAANALVAYGLGNKLVAMDILEHEEKDDDEEDL